MWHNSRRVENLLEKDARWDSNEEDIRKVRAFERQRDNLLKVEEVIWSQRSRTLWLHEGDKNTKFFHGKAEQRRKTNHICKLKDKEGRSWNGKANCEKVLISYFTKLFSSSGPTNILETCEVVKD